MIRSLNLHIQDLQNLQIQIHKFYIYKEDQKQMKQNPEQFYVQCGTLILQIEMIGYSLLSKRT